jgi:hypothetical protein
MGDRRHYHSLTLIVGLADGAVKISLSDCSHVWWDRHSCLSRLAFSIKANDDFPFLICHSVPCLPTPERLPEQKALAETVNYCGLASMKK